MRISISLALLAALSLPAAADPLVEADALLRHSVRAAAAGLGRSAAAAAPAAAPQSAPAPSYCTGYIGSGPEGMPAIYHTFCTDGVAIASWSRWCWTERCRVGMEADTKAKMSGMGLEYLGSFLAAGRTYPAAGWPVFRKAGLSHDAKGSYCLVLRSPLYGGSKGKAHYRVDCADGADSTLDIAEPGDGTSGIEGYLGKLGYVLAARFPRDTHHIGPLLFSRR